MIDDNCDAIPEGWEDKQGFRMVQPAGTEKAMQSLLLEIARFSDVANIWFQKSDIESMAQAAEALAQQDQRHTTTDTARILFGEDYVFDRCITMINLFATFSLIGDGAFDADREDNIRHLEKFEDECERPFVASGLKKLFIEKNALYATTDFLLSCDNGMTEGCFFSSIMFAMGKSPAMSPGRGLEALRKICHAGYDPSCKFLENAGR